MIACGVLSALCITGADARGQSSVEDRIARVEQGLLPRVVPRGQAERRMSIAERMAYHGVPGLSVAVIDDGRVAWARAYGVQEAGSQNLVNANTLFQAASLSKPVAAFGALLLVQRKQLEVDSDARPWLSSWKPEVTLTLRQLLSHTAGVSVAEFSGYAPGASLPNELQILQGQRPAKNPPVRVTITPGKQFGYSGYGYVAVQQIIRDVTRLPFADYMRKEVFSPLGMSQSTFGQSLSAEQQRTAARGHRRDGSKIPGGWMTHPELAAAGLWTTPTDLARLVIELQDAQAGRATRILQSEMAREMLTGRVDNVGLGVFLTGPNGASRRFIHTGRNAGFDAVLLAYKNGRQGAVVMINRNNNGGFLNEVLESIAREYAWPDYLPQSAQRELETVPSSIQASYAGVYEAAGQPALNIVFENDKLFGRSGENPWFRLYPESATQFFATDNSTRWTFVKGPDGKIGEVIARSGENELRLRRSR
jgi:CubicO group peptidase (beta-lactamase class C family)